jgi:hypothetical protein
MVPPHPSPLPHLGGLGKGEGAEWQEIKCARISRGGYCAPGMVQDLWGESPHGGTMEASNNRKRGATFAFNVPARQSHRHL